AGVSRASRAKKSAVAAGPMPPSTPSMGGAASSVVILVDLVVGFVGAVVGVERLLDGAVHHESTAVEVQAAFAEPGQLGLAMGDQHQGAPLRQEVVDDLVALLLELPVPDRERLIHQQDRMR